MNLSEDSTRPLDSSRLVGCGSFEARFEMSLPPGRYVLQAYNDTGDVYLVPDREIQLPVGSAEVDLGELAMSNSRTHVSVKNGQAKAKGDWIDVADRYGKPAPAWNIADARGIPKNAQIKDFQGKWVLIYFWGFGCPSCLRTDLPSLAKFYEEHQKDRDRFEIIAFCIDDDGELTSMAAVDRGLAPVVTHVWGGKTLPFPIAVDASFRTMQAFGISTFGPQLVDPQGNLMKGDEKRVWEKLKEDTEPRRAKITPQP